MSFNMKAADLDAYLGKPIAKICDRGYHPDAENHCAHFVSHALGITIGTLCGDMNYATRHTGATIRVNELYNGLRSRGPWDNRPPGTDGLLIFVTDANRNMINNRMGQGPQKHVGICYMGKIWNYSNGRHAVVRDASVESFHLKFKRTYHGTSISLYFGEVP
ncbi:hypothetical protein [Aliidongia dinghuensis]|nr:hypothetical protein [Aliidongia dinghuensis]